MDQPMSAAPRGSAVSSIEPSRAWILGLTLDPDGRIEAFADSPAGTPGLADDRGLLVGPCECPDDCPRDHPNE